MLVGSNTSKIFRVITEGTEEASDREREGEGEEEESWFEMSKDKKRYSLSWDELLREELCSTVRLSENEKRLNQ